MIIWNHEEIIITKYETEFVAKHKDYDVIGVGGNEFEAALELSKALGALMFSKDYKHNKVTELLVLYDNFMYHVLGGAMIVAYRVQEKILKLKAEIEEMK